jgi:hypothetical protein
MPATKAAPKIFVDNGSHEPVDYPDETQGRCIMEWVSYLYQQQHSDNPVGVHQTIRAFCINVNDSVNDEMRQRLVPYLSRMMGTFAWKALNFVAKEWTPIWLEKANYTEEAQRLRDLPELTADSTEE